MSKVRITAQPAQLANGQPNPNAGKVFTLSVNADGTPKLNKNGRPFGYIRVVEEKISLSFTQNSAIKTRSALKSMEVEAWEKSKHMLLPNTIVEDHKIIRKDSLVAPFEGAKPVQIPARDAEGKTVDGEFRTLTSGGAPVYRTETLTENMNLQDELLAYDVVTVTAGAGVGTGKAIA